MAISTPTTSHVSIFVTFFISLSSPLAVTSLKPAITRTTIATTPRVNQRYLFTRFTSEKTSLLLLYTTDVCVAVCRSEYPSHAGRVSSRLLAILVEI